MIILWHILCPFNTILPTSTIPTLTLILTFKLFIQNVHQKENINKYLKPNDSQKSN